MTKKTNTASVLSYDKRIEPSDGFMYETNWDSRNMGEKLIPLKLVEKSVRGTISNRLKAAIKNDPLKLNAEVEKANLQRVDSCALSMGCDTLHLKFTVKFLSGVEYPTACNNDEFQRGCVEVARGYIQRTGFTELAKRYATNIANGRFLWRNRVGAEEVEVQVKILNKGQEKLLAFNALEISLNNFDYTNKDLEILTEEIASTLSGKKSFLLLEIDTYSKIGMAQDVYPSEELVMDKGNKKGNKSKILYNRNDIAAIHSQKIGNALRTIDTWYPDYDTLGVGPIAAETYGAVTSRGMAYRNTKKKSDFFTLYDCFALGGKLDRVEDEHYVMSLLVRGGVFGESSKE